MDKLTILLLFGGRSGEHEVSLMSAQSVNRNLNPDRYDVVQVGITHSGKWLTTSDGKNVIEKFMSGDIDTLIPVVMLPFPSEGKLYTLRPSKGKDYLEFFKKIDVIFPLIHGTYGEDGTLQGLLELVDLPYIGAGVLGSAVGMDKAVLKDLVKAHGIPVVESVVILRSEIETNLEAVLDRAEHISKYPLFVKPVNLGSSVGITKCLSRADLVEGLFEAAKYDRRILIERGINAREIEVSVWGNDQPQASFPGEIIPSREFYSYESKYIDGTSELIIPAPIPDQVSQLARELAIKAYQIMDCAGMARVDFLMDRDNNQLYFSEVNTIPGFTEISMYSKLWLHSGVTYPQLLDKLIMFAFDRKRDRDRTERIFRRATR